MTAMRRSVPGRVLALAALAMSSGCYLSYGLGDADAAVRDASVRDAAARDAGAPDAAPRDGGRDAGRDGGLMCPLVRADYVCLESFLVQPDRAFTLPLSFAGCGCCVHSECAVAIDPAARTLHLTTTLCPDPCDCDACYTPTTSCEVPALADGDWTVNVNGSAAFTLPVFGDSGVVPPPPACVDFAEPTSCTGDLALPGIPRATRLACAYPGGAEPVAYVLELTDPCGGCARDGSCTVRLEPRFTDDLPPGGELHVDVRQYFESCADCLPACAMTTRACRTPPLVLGDFYRVHVEGVSPFTFVAGIGGERTCAGARGAAGAP